MREKEANNQPDRNINETNLFRQGITVKNNFKIPLIATYENIK